MFVQYIEKEMDGDKIQFLFNRKDMKSNDKNTPPTSVKIIIRRKRKLKLIIVVIVLEGIRQVWHSMISRMNDKEIR